MHRELLRAGRGTAREDNCLFLTFDFGDHLIDSLVVKISIIIVHPLRIRVIEPLHIRRNPLAKICLERINPHPEQGAEFSFIPFHSLRVCEINNGLSGLPVIILPDSSVLPLQKIPMFRSLFIEIGFLADIGIQPDTNFQPPLVIALQHSFRVRETAFIPLEVAPLVFAHPEAVKMKDRKRDISLFHAVKHAGYRLFVIIGREGGRQPQTVGPCRHHRRTAREGRVFLEYCLRRPTVNDEVFQLFSRHGNADTEIALRFNLKRNFPRRVDEDTIASARDIERDVFIRLPCPRTAVFIPDINRLTVLYKIGKPLSQSVYLITDIERKLFCHVRLTGLCILHISVRTDARRSQHLSAPIV